MVNDNKLFIGIVSELKRIVEAWSPTAYSFGVDFFVPQPDTVPSTGTSLIQHVVEPHSPLTAYQIQVAIGKAAAPDPGGGSPITAATDPDTLPAAPMDHKQGSSALADILEKLSNTHWAPDTSPLLHVVFTDRLPRFKGYTGGSPFDNQPVMWDDLLNSKSGNPSVEEAKAKVASSSILKDYYLIMILQVTTDGLDTRPAWRQALHAIGLDGRFSVHYLPMERSNELQNTILGGLQDAVCAYDSGSSLPVVAEPDWPPTTTEAETTTEMESTTEESTTEDTTTEESSTEETTTEESTTQGLSSTESESSTSLAAGGNVTISSTTTSTVTTETSTTTPLIMPGATHLINTSTTSGKLGLAGASITIVTLVAAAVYSLTGLSGGSPTQDVRTNTELRATLADAEEGLEERRGTLVEVREFETESA